MAGRIRKPVQGVVGHPERRTAGGPGGHRGIVDGVRADIAISLLVGDSRFAAQPHEGTQSGGEPLRTFYAFDPRRVSILLIGGIKTGNDRCYEEYVPIADRLYDDHFNELRQEGNIP